jgi:hypothetical protein
LKCVDVEQLAYECILERHRPALETTTPSTIIIISIITNYAINTVNHYRTHRIVRRRLAFDAYHQQMLTYGQAIRARLELSHGST